MRRGEEGTALLTVLLLVAVLSVLAADTLDRLSLTTRLTGTAVAIDQSRAFGQAAERLAAIRIAQLVATDPARTTNAAGWQGTPLPLPLPVGQATLTVVDGGNCFNLNSLATGGAGADPAAEPVLASNASAIAQFAALMTTLGVAPGDARTVADASADWIDSDSQPLPAGAEDAVYRAIPPGYLPANRPMASATELRAVRGVTPALWSLLRPWVCALPVSEASPINPNTLTPEQAPLLAMLAPDLLSVAQARALLGNRPADGYPSSVNFWAQPPFNNQIPNGAQIQFRSRWFDARVTVVLDGTERTTRALIDAGSGNDGPPARVVRSAAQ